MCLIYYIIHVYIYFFLLISLLSLSFCVCLLAFFFSSRDLVFISTFMLLCLELEKFSLFYDKKKKIAWQVARKKETSRAISLEFA